MLDLTFNLTPPIPTPIPAPTYTPPVTDTNTPLFQPYPHQRPVLNYLMGGGKRAVLVWHRRSGKDLTLWNWMWAASQQRIGTYFYFYPTYAQARKAIWFGMTEDGTRYLDYIPKPLIARRDDGRLHLHETDMRIHFRNGSIMQIVGTDTIDSIMSTNPIGAVFSEYSLQDPAAWRYVSPIFAKNDGWAAFAYTPRGHNHGYDLYRNTQNRPGWFSEMLTVNDTHLITSEAIDDVRATGVPEEVIQQEYYCTFSGVVEGSYFGSALNRARDNHQITHVPYDPRLLVHTAWDFGISETDATTIWFIQTDGISFRAIDFHEGHNEGLPHYANILRSKPYVYGTHLAPHDVAKREFGTGGAVIDTAADLGINFVMVPRIAHKPDAINAARMLIPRTYFDETRCERGLDGLMGYERDWDDKNKTYKSTHKHNWASHIADAFMCLACGIEMIDDVVSRPSHVHSNFNPRSYDAFNTRRSLEPPMDEHREYERSLRSLGRWPSREYTEDDTHVPVGMGRR